MKKDYEKYFIKPSIKDARKRKTKETATIDFDKYFNLQGFGKGKTYKIETFGCQGNEADTEKIRGILEALEFTMSDTLEHADIILLNTCAIRENAENRVFGELGRLKKFKKNNPDLILGVCGCMPQEEKVVERILTKFQYVDLVFGTHNIYKLPEYLETVVLSKERVIEVFSEEGSIVENMPKIRENTRKAWVNIMYGCDEFCTYCIVPYTRGKERSRNPEHIIQEVQELIDQGYKEVTLLGQNVNSYGRDFTDTKYTFSNLLNELYEMDIPRIRFTTSHPKDFDLETVQVLAKGGNLMPYIHLPVQSGSNDVLKRMNRKYTKELYMQLVNNIYRLIPNASLTTDIIVGFPGETEEDFDDYDYVVIATYAKINELLDESIQYQYEVVEKPVVKLPEQYKNKSVVVMDGPFMCLDPYKDGYHVLGHVEHAIHSTNVGDYPMVLNKHIVEYLNNGVVHNPHVTKINKFIEAGMEFFEDFDKLEHIGSMFTIRTVLAHREHDDARPTIVTQEAHNVYTIFSGKIGTCVQAANELVRRLQPKYSWEI